jgi:hypothetical protein
MSVIARDSFTDASGTALSSHTLDSGGVWTRHANSTGSMAISNGNRARVADASSATSLYYPASGGPSSADYTVRADIVAVGSTANLGFMGVAARIATAADTFYYARYNITLGAWELYKRVGGTSTLLASWSSSFTSGTALLSLTVSGTTISVDVDGTNRITQADSDISSAGKAGIRTGSSTAGSNTDGHHLDNFLWLDIFRPFLRKFRELG